MQTYTHAAMGATLGALIFPQSPSVQMVCVVASTAPDLPLVVQYFVDLVVSRRPMTRQSTTLCLLTEISHSLPLWVSLALAAYFVPLKLQTIVLAAACSGFVHIITDILTHGVGPKEDRPFWLTDVRFTWPLPGDLRPFGLWEYRYGAGVLRPKSFEVAVLLLCLTTALVQWFC